MRYVGVIHELECAGIGHRLVDVMQAVAICGMYGLRYAHSPIAITTNPRPRIPRHVYDWRRIDPWEYHLRLGEGEPSLISKMMPLDAPSQGMPQVVELWPHRLTPRRTAPRTFQLPDRPVEARLRVLKNAVEAVPDPGVLVLRGSPRVLFPTQTLELEAQGNLPRGLNTSVRRWFQSKYFYAHSCWQGASAPWRSGSYFGDDEFAIALLARYGGGHPDFDHRKRKFIRKNYYPKYVPGVHYLGLMRKLRELYPEAHMILFTDGPRDREEIAPLDKEGFEIHVCFEQYPDLFRVFHSFATADIVFDGNSGSGALPQFMGQGCVLMQPVIISVPMGPSITTEYHTGRFDVNKLKQAVEKHLR